MQHKIKSCPFCDSEPSIIQGSSKERFYKITCSNPGCNILVYLSDENKERLIERWNRRNGQVSEPKWKSEFPSKAGYWWYREGKDAKPEIVELRCNPENMDWYAVFAFTGERKRAKDISGSQWADIYFPYKEIDSSAGQTLSNHEEDRISLSPQLNV